MEDEISPNNSKRKWLTASLGIILIGFIVGGVYFLYHKNNKGSEGLDQFNLSVNTWVGYGPLYLAQEKGFFKDEGVNVNITILEDTAQRKAAMMNGTVDGLGDTVDLLVLSRDEGVPSVTVLQVDESNGADGIVTTNDIKTVQGLKGKKIAVQKNFVGESFLMYVLKKNGMSLSDVNEVDTESGAAGAAFASGQVDAAVTFEPWLSKAKERKDGKVLVSSADEPGVIVDTLSINTSYLKNHPDTVKKVARGWFKALDYWKANPQESNEIMAKHYNVSTSEFADLITGVKWPTLDENKTYFGPGEQKGKFYSIADIFSNAFLELGSIKSKPNIDDAVDKNIINNL